MTTDTEGATAPTDESGAGAPIGAGAQDDAGHDSSAGHCSSAGSRAQAALAMLTGGLDELSAVDVLDIPGAELGDLLVAVDLLGRRLDGVRTKLLLAFDASGLWALDGSRSLSAWLRRATGSSAQESGRTVRTAKALRDHLPRTAAALEEGAITTEHARLLATHTTRTPERIAALAHPAVGEPFLVEQARRLDAGDFSKVLRAWAIAADPHGADDAYAEDADRQELVLAKALHGYHIQGWLTDADGAALEAALAAVVGVPDANDGRSAAQRRAGALMTLARLALDSGELMPGAAIRPHLTVHVPHDTLVALAAAQAPPGLATVGASTVDSGEAPDQPWAASADAEEADAPDGGTPTIPAAAEAVGEGTSEAVSQGAPVTVGEPFAEAGRFSWTRAAGSALAPPEPTVIPGELDHAALVGKVPAELDDHTPIPPALLARLACDSELARVIFGPASEVLDVGRTRRLFTPAQRRAIVARDRRCLFPGCDAPPRFGEIHHSIWWYEQYGSTRVKDGVLLCWGHHDYVHAQRITITRGPAPADPAQDAGWIFTRPDGRVITASNARDATRRSDQASREGRPAPR